MLKVTVRKQFTVHIDMIDFETAKGIHAFAKRLGVKLTCIGQTENGTDDVAVTGSMTALAGFLHATGYTSVSFDLENGSGVAC